MNGLIVSSNTARNPLDDAKSFVFDEITRLAQRNINLHVASFDFKGSTKAYNIFFHDANKYDFLVFPLIIHRIAYYPFNSILCSPYKLFLELSYAEHVARLMKRVKPDFLHAHYAYPEGWVASLAKISSKNRIPLVVTLHGYDILVEPTLGYGIRLWKRYDALVRYVLNDSDLVLVASKAVFNEAAKLVSNIQKLHIIPYGVDIQYFNPNVDGSYIKQLYEGEDKQIVLTIARDFKRKGIIYLLLAIKQILSFRKDVLFIIGGYDKLLKYYELLSIKLGVSRHVIFTWKIPRDIVPKYYAASDVVVVPSLQEAWGLVATEAMACGRPVVASRVGGLPDQVIDGYNGFLVPPKDPKALADRILYLLENPSEARRMGLNGRKLAVEKFDIEKRIDKIVKLYQELVKGGGDAI
jgi:glycosyltransferase involved in cell wall biosynthesis